MTASDRASDRTASARAWSPTAARLPECGCDHDGTKGTFDETARRVDHYELAAAELLMAEGHAVRSLPELRGTGPKPDFDVCGLLVEIKTLIPQHDRPSGRPANDRATYNRLVSGIDQAPVTVLMTRGSGLRPADAAGGMQRFAARPRAGKTQAVRIVGDGWDLAWKAPIGAERTEGRPDDQGRRRSEPQRRSEPHLRSEPWSEARSERGGSERATRGQPTGSRGRGQPSRGQGVGLG